MKTKLKTLLALFLALLLAVGSLTACTITWKSGKPEEAGNADDAAFVSAQNDGSDALENLSIDTYIELNGSSAAITGSGAAFENGVLTVSAPGVYSLKGTLSDGQVVVNTEEDGKVKLLLNGVNIHCSTSAPLLILSSPKETKVLLAEGSENTLSDEANRSASGEEDPTAVIYSKDDLEISGTGTLNLEANYSDGIVSKDDLQISGGTLNVTAADDALRGKDSVTVSGGVLNLKSGGDGICTSNEEKGRMEISGGVLNVDSAFDGLQSAGTLNVSGGTMKITSGGGCNESVANSSEMRGSFDGAFGKDSKGSNTSSDGAVSAKGLKADGSLLISGGSLTLNCLDDAIHGNADVTVSGGSLTIKTNDDGIHADTDLTVSGGSVKIEQSYEGLEGNTVTVTDGTVDVTASDDGVNAAPVSSQSDTSFFSNFFDNAQGAVNDRNANTSDVKETALQTPPTGENGRTEMPADGNFTPPTDENGEQRTFPGGRSGGFSRRAQDGDNAGGGAMGSKGEFGYDASSLITITGGSITVSALGDGIDSNGDIKMTGGSLTVYGPTNNGNGALDYGGSFEMTGGTLLAVGSAGMAQGVSSGFAAVSTQCSIDAGDRVELRNANGKTLASFTAPKQIGHLVYADETLLSGKNVSVLVNGNAAVTATAK